MALNNDNIEWINSKFSSKDSELVINFLNTYNGSIKRYALLSPGELVHKITINGGDTVIGHYVLSDDLINNHIIQDIQAFTKQNNIRNTPEYRLYKELRTKYEYTYQFFNT